jgi:hypothetical protein
VQSDAAAAARISARNWLCDAARIEANLGKLAARLTRRALGVFRRNGLMFSKLFGTKKPYTQVQSTANQITFLGEPTGEAIARLKSELAVILAAEGNVTRAFLSTVRHGKEDQSRVALIIDGRAPAGQMVQVIAPACQPVVEIDIFFFESLSPFLIEHLQESIRPFFPPAESENKLFLINVHVGRGSNTDMPRKLIGAFIPVFVAASDSEAAVLEVVKQLKEQGFALLDVPDEKIYQLDPLDWQSYVESTWPEFESQFPSQEVVIAGLPYGLMFFGPFAGYDK